MKIQKLLQSSLFVLLCIATPSFVTTHAFEGITEFSKQCSAVQEFPKSFGQSLVSLEQFEGTCMQHAITAKKQLTAQATWIDNKMPEETLFDYKRSESVCEPFVQRIIVPNGTTISLFGDLHGSIHSLVRNLHTLKNRGYIDDAGRIIKPDFFMFFLGDFVDRGYYGVEVTYVLMRLKIANPDKVFLVRGNHEDIAINAQYHDKGFKGELDYKFANNTLTCTWYDLLPAAIYLGSPTHSECHNYVLCCHGGLEAGFDPRMLLDYPKNGQIACQLIGNLHRKTEIDRICANALKQDIYTAIPDCECQDNRGSNPSDLGFLWSDFIIDDPVLDNCSTTVRYTKGRGWVFGRPLTQALLAQNSTKISHIQGVMRAHQHHGPMLERLRKNHGAASLWDGLVHTFLSAPSVTQDLASCGFGLLKTAFTYQKWHLELVTS